MITIGGKFEERFAEVASEFAQIIESSSVAGCALSIWHEGRSVVDLWGGVSERNSSRPWSARNAAVIFSCTKGLMSLAIAKLFESGEFEYDDRVTRFWPEYGKYGKDQTSIKDALSHRAGVPFFSRDIAPSEVIDWNFMISRIENEMPLWNPGSNYAYHAITHGWLAGELIRRISGLTPGEFLQKEISAPLNAETWLGISEDIELLVAPSFPRQDLVDFFVNLQAKNTPEGNFLIRSLTLGSAFGMNLVGEDSGFNSKEVHQSEIPGAGGISTARGLAKIWSSTVSETEGIRTINDATIDVVTRVQSSGKPFTDLEPPYSRFGMGFQLDSEARRYLTSSSFGHDGAGGQCAFADPQHKIGFAFITTEMGGGEIEDNRATRLIGKLRDSLQN